MKVKLVSFLMSMLLTSGLFAASQPQRLAAKAPNSAQPSAVQTVEATLASPASQPQTISGGAASVSHPRSNNSQNVNTTAQTTATVGSQTALREVDEPVRQDAGNTIGKITPKPPTPPVDGCGCRASLRCPMIATFVDLEMVCRTAAY